MYVANPRRGDEDMFPQNVRVQFRLLRTLAGAMRTRNRPACTKPARHVANPRRGDEDVHRACRRAVRVRLRTLAGAMRTLCGENDGRIHPGCEPSQGR